MDEFHLEDWSVQLAGTGFSRPATLIEAINGYIAGRLERQREQRFFDLYFKPKMRRSTLPHDQ